MLQSSLLLLEALAFFLIPVALSCGLLKIILELIESDIFVFLFVDNVLHLLVQAFE